MNSKKALFILSLAVVGVGLAILGWFGGSAQPSSLQEPSLKPATQSASSAPVRPSALSPETTQSVNLTPSPTKIDANYVSGDSDPFVTQLKTATSSMMPQLLARIGQLPDSPVKDDLLLSALKKWAKDDGAAALQWAVRQPQMRSMLPSMLTEWAGVSTDSAAQAWAVAKRSVGVDGDTETWLDPSFVKTAFGKMAATPGDGVWQELKGLSGTAQVQAMFGVADFASNRQTNTEFAANVETRTLDLQSSPMAAAFYAAAGHIQAAKDDLANVTDADQWHVIAQEVAKQQAVFEPSKAIEWLASQYSQPAEAIGDMVNSIGMTHALNAGDVLAWLRGLPSSDQQAQGISKILVEFPELRTDVPVQTVVVK